MASLQLVYTVSSSDTLQDSRMYQIMNFVLVALVLVAVLLFFRKIFPSKDRLPGPFLRLPFLGNGFLVGRHAEQTFTKWKDTYGDIFRCHLGRKEFVVLSNPHTIRKVFAQDAATGRDHNRAMARLIGPYGEPGIMFSEGKRWSTHRQFLAANMRELMAKTNWLEETILEEVDRVVHELTEKAGAPTNPRGLLKQGVGNVICRFLFGEQFSSSNQEDAKLIDLLSANIEAESMEVLVAVFPFLLRLPGPVKRTVARARQQRVDLLVQFGRLVNNRFCKNADGTTVNCYVDAYKYEQESTGSVAMEDMFDGAQLIQMVQDLFGPGSEPITSSLLWTIVFLLENPLVLERMQEEADVVVSNSTRVRLSHRDQMPYTEAVIMEVQRCASVVPVAVAHRLLADTNVEGYNLKKDTVLIPNFYGIHHDSRWWKNPDDFDPTRFLDESGKIRRHSALLPFSTGKRACVGEALAKVELFLFTANMIRCFDLHLPAVTSVSHTDYVSSIVSYPVPFEVSFLLRR